MTTGNIAHNYIPRYREISEIQDAIIMNSPIEEKLNVIMVISNPCQFKRRKFLAQEFIKRMNSALHIKLYIVELVYSNHQFELTVPNCSTHLQIRAEHVLWHKENMINMGIKMFDDNWKAFAFIDADIEFENPLWAIDTLKILNGSRDVVQLFSHAVDLNPSEDAMLIFAGFGYQYTKKRNYTSGNVLKLFHPGYCWAMTRKAYMQLDGLYENSILGSGDHQIAMSLIGLAKESLHINVTKDYLNDVLKYQEKVKRLRIGYVHGVIRHYWHGSKESRRYKERWEVLIKHKYSPLLHITKREDGLLVPTKECPKEMLDEIMEYFRVRNEDQ